MKKSEAESQHKARVLTAAIKERKALRQWEKDGADPDTRPLTPAIDEIESVQHMPKSERKTSSGGGRKPSQLDESIKEAFSNGTITFASTVGEIATAVEAPSSSCQHATNRLVAEGYLTVTTGRPRLFWAPSVGDAADRPERETTQRTRKVHAVKGKSGKVAHGAHAHRGENGTEYVAVCTDVEIVDPTKVGDETAVTCKRCLKALDVDQAA